MSSQPVEANVVLTADNTQYDQAMNQSSGVTQNLGQNVDTLGSKISKLTKVAGKSLIGISAADIALIGGATAAWASYEKQMSRLQAQSAVLGRTNTEQNKLMKDYTASVKGLRTEFGVTTTEAANLIQTLSKVTTLRQSAGLADLSKVFVEMSNATGESSQGLASSLTNLQKLMGTPINTKTTRQYADQFTYLAAQTNTSAQGLMDFAAQLAPAGRQIGMHEKAIAGWSTAFAKAGQDSGPAIQLFTKITTDIAHSMATGSPEIAHYANVLGVTQRQFKQMGGDEQVLRLFEKLHSEGKGASSEISRLGLDGPRSIRALQAVLQPGAGGSLRETLGLVDDKAVKGAAGRGSAAVMDDLSTSMEKLKDQSQQLAETFGEMFGPAINKFVQGMTKGMEIINKVASGPIGQLIGWIMKLIAPFAAGAGAILLFAGALLKLAGVFTLLRNSMVGGVREGFKGGAAIGALGEENQYMARGTDREMGAFGQKLAGITSDRPGSWLQRAQYNAGVYGGRGVRAIPSAIRDAALWGREKIQPSYVRPPPGEARSPMSYVAGGLGRAIDMMVTPTFDQMRYDDPTKRMASRMVGQVAPWTTMKQRLEYVGALGQEHLAGRQMSAVEAERTRITQEPLLTDAQRMAQHANLDVIEKETKARAAAAAETKASVMSQIEATKDLNTQVGNTSTGFRRLRESLVGGGGLPGGGAAGAYGGGILGALKTGARGFAASGAAWPVGGMAGSLAAAQFAPDSKMLQFGAMGAMMGPWGLAGGAAVGATMDIINSNKDLFASVDAVRQANEENLKTGAGITQEYDLQVKAQEKIAKDKKDFETGGLTWGGGPGQWWGREKNLVEGIFGSSDIEEAQGQYEEEKKRAANIEAVARDMARGSDIKITGTATQQRKKLDDFMSTLGAQRFEQAGIDPEQLIAARAKAQNKVTQEDLAGTGLDADKINKANQKAYQDMLNKVVTSTLGPGIEERLKQTAAGKAMEASPAAQEALKHQESVEATYKGIQQMYDNLREQGKSNIAIMHTSTQAMHQIGDENTKQFELQMGLFSKAQQNLGMQMPMMSRAQQFQTTIQSMGALENITPTTAAQRGLLEQQKMTTAQGVAGTVDYVKQMLLMQDQYEISRQRAQEDYAEQQAYQLHDFNLQRSRAEYQFNLGRQRATADYYRNVRRGNYEFNLQRRRQEEDFNHQTKIQAEQMAASVYDIYQRVQVERTSSAQWLIANAHDQLVKMQEQEKNLNTLRAEGLSNAAIRTLRLNDPQQAQQAAALVAEMTPQLIRQMNQVAGKARISAAKDLMMDPANLEQQERLRSYRRSRQQNLEDHNRSMRWSRQDFMRQLKQQKDDFNLLLHQQDVDFQTSVNRQEKAYKKSMDRSAEDLANAGKEITGSIESILKQGSTHLTGYAKDTADAALKTFQNLKTSTRPVAISIMKDLADIFGFEYTPPKVHSSGGGATGTSRGGGQRTTGGRVMEAYAKGGVVPGWSPGNDDKMVPVSGGEAIMRPEWARKVGKKRIDEMNAQAARGGFAKGGVVWPLPNSSWSTYPGHDGIDLNQAGEDYGKPFYAAVPGKITYVGWDHGYGDAIFETGPYGTLVYGHGSKVAVHAGQTVKAGQWIGNVGSTGHSTGPHLHFGFPGGTPQQALALLHGADMSGYGESVAISPAMTRKALLKQVLKDQYPDAEKSAYAMAGVHPLNPGDISQVINRYAKHAIRRLVKKYGMPGAEGDAGAIFGNEPSANLSNEGIVHVGANRMGWKDQWGALRQIVMHESGFNNTAQNPTSTAYGMFQFLDSTWGNYGFKKTSDPWIQTQAGLKYIKERYKDPQGAWKFWQEHNWYGDGSVFTSPQTIGVGERGPEAVIPLNDRGANFITDVMAHAMGGRHMAPAGRNVSVFNTRIDKSTNFTGPITVQANDPEHLIRQLQQRQRVMALSRPSLTGSAA